MPEVSCARPAPQSLNSTAHSVAHPFQLHRRPSDRTLALGRIAIFSTAFVWLGYAVFTVFRLFVEPWAGNVGFAVESLAYLLVVSVLTLSALLYLIARQGALERFRTHVRVPRAALDRFFTGTRPALTVLVPSSDQGASAVRRSLWSAALQEYPALRVVLLLDEFTSPSGPRVSHLEELRRIPTEISNELAPLRTKFKDAQLLFEREMMDGLLVASGALSELADHYAWAAAWLHRKADVESGADAAGRFFADEVLRGLGDELELTAVALFAAGNQGETPSVERMSELYRRLVWTFDATLNSFERREFASLSHEATRAMNLNVYIGLMGGSYRLEDSPDGVLLSPSGAGERADLVVPDADYVLTLDASSLLLRDYCLRLVHTLEQPLSERVAVAQTPYSSIPCPSTRLGMVVGATTDLQHIQHQGMSYFGATFLVGAAALIRKRALDEIVHTELVGQFEIRRYFRDRTVVEDTESGVDLGSHGWSILNYPERLSYTEPPADFGSLVISRRRRANGGLTVLPQLLRQASERRRRGERVPLVEMLLRVNALTSAAVASVGILFLLVYPHSGALPSGVLLLTALPYFLARRSDLRSSSHRSSTVFGVYGVQLLLMPMHLAGVSRSIRQAITNTRVPFTGTRAVRGRTVTPLTYVLVPFALLVWISLGLARGIAAQNWSDTAFAAFHAAILLFAAIAFMGVWNNIVDVWLGLTGGRRDGTAGRHAADAAPGPLDWKAVLYHGHADGKVPRSLLGSSPDAPRERRRADGAGDYSSGE